ncbi:MAG: D-alanyl-D-alanine carboxypeptidase/D-alanyl-D-alanine-endopeptidase [Cyanobacteria bacterium P01_H01_bin.130]
MVQPLSAASDRETPLSPPWLSHNADQFFNPASNAKLLTTAAILTQLGSNHAVSTSLFLDPSPDSSPNLWVYTLGNPTLDQPVLDRFAQAVKQGGVQGINTLWVNERDIGLMQEGRISSWEWGDLPFGYATPASTAIFNNNQVVLELTGTQPGQLAQVSSSDAIALQQWDIKNQVITAPANDDLPSDSPPITITPGWPNVLHLRGTIPPGARDQATLAIPNPAQYLGDSFKHTLEQQGIPVTQVRVSRGSRIQRNQVVLDIYASPLTGELIGTINRFSNNLYAEVLLGWLQFSVPSEIGSPAARSRTALDEALAELGISPDSYRIADGSGLSRQNLITPQALVTLLNGMWRSPESLTFQRSLPIAGETGTLINRFKDTPLQGQLIAKTGTLTGVSALSGYFPHEDSQTWVAFSILVNHSNQPASVLRQAMDDLLVAIAETPRHCFSQP